MTTKPKRATISDPKTSNYYTLYLDNETFEKLSAVARANGRTKIGQLRVLLGIK